MPPIQPSSGLTPKSRTVTSADIINTNVMEVDSYKILSLSVIPDALYDGVCKVQVKNSSGSWDDIDTNLGTNSGAFGDEIVLRDGSTALYMSNTTSFPSTEYPFSMRILVTTKATQGSLSIEVNYL